MFSLLCIVSACALIQQASSFPQYYEVDTVVSGFGVGQIYSVAIDPHTGDQYFSGYDTNVISKVSMSGFLSVLAGTRGVSGRTDGTGATAQFSVHVLQICYCKFDGKFYMVDSGNNILRQMTTKAEIKTIAGGTTSGYTNGIGTNALLNVPWGLACNSINGDVIIGDTGNKILRLLSSPSRNVTLFAGRLGISGFADGMGTYAIFSGINHIVQNPVNLHFYLVDSYNNFIRQVTSLGLVSSFAGRLSLSGTKDGLGTLAYFYGPLGISCDDATGNIIVGDFYNHRIRAIDVSSRLVTTIAGSVKGAIVNGIGTFTQVYDKYLAHVYI